MMTRLLELHTLLNLNLLNCNIKKDNGNENNQLSILSKTPPCPGKSLPVSLIFNFLLKKDTYKSPINDDMIIIITYKNKVRSFKL